MATKLVELEPGEKFTKKCGKKKTTSKINVELKKNEFVIVKCQGSQKRFKVACKNANKRVGKFVLQKRQKIKVSC